MSTYTIASGDTLWKIATDHGVSLQALTAANPQITNPDVIHPGQELTIPQGDAAPPAQNVQNVPGPAAEPNATREVTGGVNAASSVPPPAMPPPPPLASPADSWSSGRPSFKTVAYFTNWVCLLLCYLWIQS